jgi:hypothetical protein
VAENGGELIRARTSEGRERAKARGVKLGRKPKLTETPEARGDQTARQARRAGARDRAQLQRQPQHDFAACGLIQILCSTAPSNEATGEVICSARSCQKRRDKLPPPVFPLGERSEHFAAIWPGFP